MQDEVAITWYFGDCALLIRVSTLYLVIWCIGLFQWTLGVGQTTQELMLLVHSTGPAVAAVAPSLDPSLGSPEPVASADSAFAALRTASVLSGTNAAESG